MAAVRASELDRRCRLLERTDTQDATGSVVEGWAEFAEVFCGVVPNAKGATGEIERDNGVVVQAQFDVTFLLRWRADIKRAGRVRYAGADYDIVAVLEVGRRAGLQVRAVASVA